MPSYLIEQILKTKKITDYLAKKGHHPIGSEVNGRLKYLCPLHNERTPSFTVYLNSDYENFFCYGCKKRHNIVHLYRDMECVSTREAIKVLSEDLSLDVESEISHAVDQIQNDHSTRSEFTVPELALIISRCQYDFVQMINYDKNFIAKVDKLSELVDRVLDEDNIEALKVLVDCVPDKLIWLARKNAESAT